MAKTDSRKNNKAVQEIYEYYCRTFGKNPNRYRLLPERRKKIAARLKTFSVEEIKKAITNLSQSSFHLANGYTGLDFVLRNDAKTEEWAEKDRMTLIRQNVIYYRQNPAARKIMAQTNRQPVSGNQQAITNEIDDGNEKELALRTRAEKAFNAMPQQERDQRIEDIQQRLRRDPRNRGWSDEAYQDTAVARLKEELI